MESAPSTPALSEAEGPHPARRTWHVARPHNVTLLALLVLTLTAWNGLRLGKAVASWKVLAEYGAKPGPLYITVSGAFWLLAGIPLFVGIWRGKAWARIMAYIAAAGYASWYWCDRLFLQGAHVNWPFALVVIIVLLAFTVLTLLGSKQFFTQRDS